LCGPRTGAHRPEPAASQAGRPAEATWIGRQRLWKADSGGAREASL
jgi:hypothetical protein